MSECTTCAHSRRHGHWGPTVPSTGTHCRRCHATWTGTAAAHTPCCCTTFGGNRGADLFHDKLERELGRCPTEADLIAEGMAVTDDRRGRVLRQPSPAVRATANAESSTQPPKTAHSAKQSNPTDDDASLLDNGEAGDGS